MNFSEIFIRRPVMTILCVLTIIFFGIFSYLALPTSDVPDIAFPSIEVSVVYPGADPTTIANNVVTPLEQQFAIMEGVKTIASTSKTGSATIALEFLITRDLDGAATDVISAINAASQQLPQDLPYQPTYQKTNPSASPILLFTVTSDTLTLSDLYRYTHTVLGEQLNMIEGVSQVQVFGSPYAVRIQVDPQKLASRNIGLDEFASAIQTANVYLPTGTLYGPKTEYTIDCSGQITEAEGYRNLVIKAEDGMITRVSDVANAFDSLWNDKIFSYYFNKNISSQMVGFSIEKMPHSNTLEIIEAVNEKLPKLISQLPGSMKLWRMYDQSNFIKESVLDVKMTLLLALGLVVFVIFVYLGKFINTIIPALAIPISILGTFIVMQLLGYSLDILSLLALTLSIGFLVDDAIVVLENIARHVEEGESTYEGAIRGSKQISLTVFSMTICLAIMFIPLLFMEGIIGKLLHEFSVTIITAVLFSGLVSLTFTPMLCSRLVSTYKLDRELTRVEKISKALNNFFLKLYKPSLEWGLKHRKSVLMGGLVSLVGSIFLLVYLPKDFLPQDDIGFIEGFSRSQDGTSPYESKRQAEKIGELAINNPYIAQAITISGLQQDNMTGMWLRLTDINKRPPMNVVMNDLYEKIALEVPSVQLALKPLPLINLDVGAVAPEGSYEYTLKSLDSKDLYKATTGLQDRMRKLKEIANVTSNLDISQPQLHIEIQRDKAFLYGITAQQIENALSLAYANTNLSPINEPDNQYYVIMETLPRFYKDPEMLNQLWLRAQNSNELVPLSELVTTKENVGPLTVSHLDGLPSATISFDLAKGVALGTALDAIDNEVALVVPPTVFSSVAGAANIFKESFKNLNILLIISLFIIYVILGILYENFFHPITVMSTLPPAALGGFLSLVIFGYSFSLYAFVGIIMLLGIVLKNGIIMIDFANEKIEKEKLSPHDAITAACQARLRPILMTTFAALVGALPIALGIGGLSAEGRKPLGVVIVGGLIFSQILTLYLTPVTYIYIEKFREWIHTKFRAIE